MRLKPKRELHHQRWACKHRGMHVMMRALCASGTLCPGWQQMARAPPNEPWTGTDLLLTKGTGTCGVAGRDGGGQSPAETLQDPTSKERTSAKTPPLDQEESARDMKGGHIDCKGVKAQGFLRNSVCCSGHCTTIKILPGTQHLGHCYRKCGVKMAKKACVCVVCRNSNGAPVRSLEPPTAKGSQVPSVKVSQVVNFPPRVESECSTGNQETCKI